MTWVNAWEGAAKIHTWVEFGRKSCFWVEKTSGWRKENMDILQQNFYDFCELSKVFRANIFRAPYYGYWKW